MRKVMIFFLLVCGLLISCGESGRQKALSDWMASGEKPRVLATTEMVADAVEAVSGGRVDLLTLIRGGVDPHSYELVKGDAEKFSRADVVFCNGLGLEHGASLQAQLKKHRALVSLGDRVIEQRADAAVFFGDQIDPHIWMDMSLWKEIVDPIVETLSAIDPEGRAQFEANGKKLKERFEQEDRALCEMLGALPKERRYLVTTHDAFHYFTRRYLAHGEERANGHWRARCCAPEGLAPESQMSLRDIQCIVEYLTEHKVGVVFPESNLSEDALKRICAICKGRGVAVALSSSPLYGDSLGEESYFSMMRWNATTIYDALSKDAP